MLSSPALGTRLNLFQKLLLATLPRIAPDGRAMSVPYHTAHYDFRLVPEALAA